VYFNLLASAVCRARCCSLSFLQCSAV
jgi:hypothetical protein